VIVSVGLIITWSTDDRPIWLFWASAFLTVGSAIGLVGLLLRLTLDIEDELDEARQARETFEKEIKDEIRVIDQRVRQALAEIRRDTGESRRAARDESDALSRQLDEARLQVRALEAQLRERDRRRRSYSMPSLLRPREAKSARTLGRRPDAKSAEDKAMEPAGEDESRAAGVYQETRRRRSKVMAWVAVILFVGSFFGIYYGANGKSGSNLTVVFFTAIPFGVSLFAIWAYRTAKWALIAFLSASIFGLLAAVTLGATVYADGGAYAIPDSWFVTLQRDIPLAPPQAIGYLTDLSQPDPALAGSDCFDQGPSIPFVGRTIVVVDCNQVHMGEMIAAPQEIQSPLGPSSFERYCGSGGVVQVPAGWYTSYFSPNPADSTPDLFCSIETRNPVRGWVPFGIGPSSNG